MEGWHKKLDVMRRYDATAHMYDKRYAEEQKLKIEAALNYVDVGKADLVLDVGCGTGVLFDYVASEAAMTVGLDISEKTLQVARERAKQNDHVHLVWGDADNMPFKSQIFDKVFAMTILQNTPSATNTLGEIDRVAKEEALVIITGMKKIFSRTVFEQLLKLAGLKKIVTMSKNLQCYVSICAKAKGKLKTS